MCIERYFGSIDNVFNSSLKETTLSRTQDSGVGRRMALKEGRERGGDQICTLDSLIDTAQWRQACQGEVLHSNAALDTTLNKSSYSEIMFCL